MTNNNTMTQVSALTAVLAILNGETSVADYDTQELANITAKISAMVDNLNKKRETPTKADLAKMTEHETIMTQIFDTLVELNKPSTITEIQAANTALAIYSTSKMSAMLKKLVDNGKVVRTIEKKKARFSIVTAD